MVSSGSDGNGFFNNRRHNAQYECLALNLSANAFCEKTQHSWLLRCDYPSSFD